MRILTVLALFFISISFQVRAEDDSVKITVFELNDGVKHQALRFLAQQSGADTTFMITTVEGKKLTIKEKDVKERNEVMTPLAELPEQARASILKQRSANKTSAATADTEKAATDLDKKSISASKATEVQCTIALNNAKRALAQEEASLVAAQRNLKDLEDRHDAATRELTQRPTSAARNEVSSKMSAISNLTIKARCEMLEIKNRIAACKQTVAEAEVRLSQAKAESARAINLAKDKP